MEKEGVKQREGESKMQERWREKGEIDKKRDQRRKQKQEKRDGKGGLEKKVEGRKGEKRRNT